MAIKGNWKLGLSRWNQMILALMNPQRRVMK